MVVLHKVYRLVSQRFDSNTNMPKYGQEKKNKTHFFSLKKREKKPTQNETIKIKIPNIVDKVGYRILLFWISRLFYFQMRQQC